METSRLELTQYQNPPKTLTQEADLPLREAIPHESITEDKANLLPNTTRANLLQRETPTEADLHQSTTTLTEGMTIKTIIEEITDHQAPEDKIETLIMIIN